MLFIPFVGRGEGERNKTKPILLEIGELEKNQETYLFFFSPFCVVALFVFVSF